MIRSSFVLLEVFFFFFFLKNLRTVKVQQCIHIRDAFIVLLVYEPQHEIANNVVCATSKGSEQPAHMRSVVTVFASRWNILRKVSY